VARQQQEDDMPGTGIHLNRGETLSVRWIWPADEAVEAGAREYLATAMIIRCTETQVTLHLDAPDAERLAAIITEAVAQRRADLARAREAINVR
jgi:hypothetical protein